MNAPLVGFIEIFRCTPLLVQIVWFYYALPVILDIQLPAAIAATLLPSFPATRLVQHYEAPLS